MKKKLILSAMLVGLLVLGLTLSGCPTDSDGGSGKSPEEEAAEKLSFIGTWRDGDPNYPQDTEYAWEYSWEFVFIDSTNFTLISPYLQWEKPGTGTYKIRDAKIVYTELHGYIKQGIIDLKLDQEWNDDTIHWEWSFDFGLTESWFWSDEVTGQVPYGTRWFERNN
jgi:hypothetical protein